MNNSTFKCFVSSIKQDLEFLYVGVKFCVSVFLAMAWFGVSAMVLVVWMLKISNLNMESNVLTDNVGYLLIVDLIINIIVWICYRAYQAINNQK